MTLIDTITKRKPGRQPLPSIEAPAIAAKLANARAAVEAAEARYNGLSFDFARGEIDQSPVDDAARELASARQLVDTLSRAHEVALVHDRDAQEVNKRHLQAQQLRNLEKVLAERDEAARRLSAALVEATTHFHELIEKSEKAVTFLPTGVSDFPIENEFGRSHLSRLVSHEAYRVSASPKQDKRELPGSTYPSQLYKFNPQGIPALVDTIAQTSAFVLKALKAKASGAAE